MIPPIQHPVWGPLPTRVRALLIQRMESERAMIDSDIQRHTRFAKQGGHKIRFEHSYDDFAQAVKAMVDGPLLAWRRKSLITGAMLCLVSILVLIMPGPFGGVAPSLIFLVGANALACAVFWIAGRQSLNALPNDQLDHLVALGRRCVIIDAEAVHDYHLPPSDWRSGVRRTPNDSLSSVTFGWAKLPDLMLMTKHRKTDTRLDLALDPSGKDELDHATIDTIMRGIYGARYHMPATKMAA